MKESELREPQNILGAALFYLGERDRAATLLASLKRGDQPDARSQAMLAGVLASLGRADEARVTIARLIEARYMDHHVAYSLGAAFAQLGRPAEAVKLAAERPFTKDSRVTRGFSVIRCSIRSGAMRASNR